MNQPNLLYNHERDHCTAKAKIIVRHEIPRAPLMSDVCVLIYIYVLRIVITHYRRIRNYLHKVSPPGVGNYSSV